MQILILALVFFGTLMLLVGTFVFVNRRRLAEAGAVRARLAGVPPVPAGVTSIVKDERASEVPFLNRLLTGKALTARLSAELARAGSRRRPGELVLASAASAATLLATGVAFVGMPLALPFGVLGGGVPYLLVRRRQEARARRFEEQLPDALDMLVNALNAGYSLQAAMEAVGQEVPAPLGPEFARFYDEQRLGVDVRAALLAMQERVGTVDAKIFVTSLLIQRETGGNLGEVLGNLAALVRERVAFRGTVATLTAEPRMSAHVLALLPVAVFGFISATNREFMHPLLGTHAGHLLLAYAVASVFVGYVVLMNLAKVDL